MNNNDLYDINSYTESQLYDILDLNHPTDRELEAKILSNIELYQTNETKIGRQLYHFFQDVYDYFFEPDEVEGFQIQTNPGENASLQFGNQTLTFTGNVITGNTVTGNIVMGAQSANYPTISPDYTPPPDNLNPIQNSGNSQEIFQTNYTSDPTGINPLLNKTIQRIICVDSQFRNKTYQPVSTNYTFNLSEPLTNVVSLSLYSVNIPYTWYTIRRGYGSNFYYYKGNSPGINNDLHNYKVTIPPGNYAPSDLQNSIEKSIYNLPNVYTDVNFGQSDISYSSLDSLIRFTTDIQKVYNECYYQLEFSDISMANFLGYSNPIMKMNTIVGKQLTDTRQSIYSTNQYTYKFDSTNNYFIIHRYTSTSAGYHLGNIITDISYQVTIPIPQITNALNIFNSINTALSQSPFIESNIQYIPLNDSIGHYEMKIVLDRYKIAQLMPNEKIVIMFPNDPLWLDTQTTTSINQNLFHFSSEIAELSILVADNPLPVNTIKLDGKSKIQFECTRLHYETGNNFVFNTPSAIWNTIYIPNFLKAILLDNTYFQSQKYHYNTQLLSNATNVIIDSSNNIEFDIYILKQFDDYIIEITDAKSVLHTSFNLAINTPYNTNTVYTSSIEYIGNNIVFDTSYICTFYPNKNTTNNGNWNDISYNIYLTKNTVVPSNGRYSYSNYFTLRSDIISSMTDTSNQSYDNHFIMNNTEITPSRVFIDETHGYENFMFNFSIINIITQSDYIVHFTYDGSYNNIPADPAIFGSNNSGSVNLWAFLGIQSDYIGYQDNSGVYHYDVSFNLKDEPNHIYTNETQIVQMPINEIRGTTQILPPQKYRPLNSSFITIRSNMITDLSGVLSEITNQFIINIPIQEYDLNTLYQEINTLFSYTQTSYSSINGSNIYYKYINTNDANSGYYTSIYMNVNIIYTTKDYNLVFFDNVSFTACSYGESTILNAKIDNSLGWILGYRNYSLFNMILSNQVYDLASDSNFYLSPSNSYFNYASTIDPISGLEIKTITQISGDTTVTCGAIYNYFLIVLDDYIQNHLNDGLVTVTKPENQIPIPSYSERANYVLDPVTKKCIAISNTDPTANRLTQKQLYALNTVTNQINPNSNYSDSPYVQDIFGIVPIKSGTNGQYYVEFGGTLQSQQRKYFGPVNIHRMSIQLVDDKGHIVDLNNSEWTFSLVCEQLYMQPSSSK